MMQFVISRNTCQVSYWIPVCDNFCFHHVVKFHFLGQMKEDQRLGVALGTPELWPNSTNALILRAASKICGSPAGISSWWTGARQNSRRQKMSERGKQYYIDNPDYKYKRLDTQGQNKPFDIFKIDGTFVKTFNYQCDAIKYLQKEKMSNGHLLS